MARRTKSLNNAHYTGVVGHRDHRSKKNRRRKPDASTMLYKWKKAKLQAPEELDTL